MGSPDDLLDTSVAIETPEHVVFRYRVAGPARRALAHALDLIVCYALVGILGLLIVAAVAGFASISSTLKDLAELGFGAFLLVLFFAQWVYFFLWEGVAGRTPGKMLLSLRVVSTDGRAIGLTTAALRNVLRAADLAPAGYLVGLISMALSPKFQRVGDLVANTMVVVQHAPRLPAPIVLLPPISAAEEAALPNVVVLDAEEREALELFVRRRSRLHPAREEELARVLAPSFASVVMAPVASATRLLALLYDRGSKSSSVDSPPSSRSFGS